MNHVDRDQDAILVQQYDELVMLPLSKIVMDFLNPSQVVGPIPPTFELPLISIGLFGLVASTHETIEGFYELNYLCSVSSMWRM